MYEYTIRTVSIIFILDYKLYNLYDKRSLDNKRFIKKKITLFGE